MRSGWASSKRQACSRNKAAANEVPMASKLTPTILLGATVVVAAFIGSAPANAQADYPNRPITAIIPFAGGSASDVVSRIMFERMSKNMGQPIIVENKPGAGGNSGTLQGARATPDGYTIIGGGSGPIAANLSLYRNLGYDPDD